MKRTRGRIVHVESLSDLDRRLAAGARRLSGWRVRLSWAAGSRPASPTG
ncbi:hypothetical protein [Nocardioides sp. CCNWLW212]